MRFHFSCTRNPHTEREVYTMRTPRLRLLSAILAVAMFFTLLPVSALAEGGGSTGVSHAAIRYLNTDNKDIQGLTYTLHADRTATVASYDNSTPDGVIDIPDTVTSGGQPYTVTAIGEYAFNPSQKITKVSSVFIPATVLSIGDSAFRCCKFLATVTFAEDSQLKSIERAAFYGAEHAYPRFKEIKIPDSVETIGSGAFRYCQNLERIALPSALQKLSNVTFYGCTALSEVTFPASLKTIESSAFSGCRNLSKVELPTSLTTIEKSVFDGCSRLETVFYDGSLEQWNQITANKDADNDANNDVLGYSCPSLVTGDYTAQFILVEDNPYDYPPPKTVTITKYTGTESTTAIPETIGGWPVTKIEENAFNNNTNLETVNFSGSKTQWDNITGKDALSNIRLVCGKLEATFTADGTTLAPAQTIDRGGKFTKPAAPSKENHENHTFAGWYNGDKPFDFDADTTNAPNVLNLVAKWDINKYTVQFVSDHGSFANQTIEYGGTIKTDKLTIPEVEGYTFGGWYTDDTYTKEFDFKTPITGDTKVYAKWEKNAPVLPDTYALNVSGAFVYVDGVDVTAPAGDTTLHLEKDASVRLVADPDRMPSGMVFDRWTILNGALNADDAEKFETGRTLEEFAFTMPAEPLSIEATPRMQEEEGSDTVSVIAGVTLGTAATALVAWQAYDLGMSLYQEHWLPADFVMPKTRAELALLLWNTAGRPAPAAQPAFADITDPDTAQAAQWAVETGLMTPKSADRFKPEKSVTRWKAVRSWKRVTNQNT